VFFLTGIRYVRSESHYLSYFCALLVTYLLPSSWQVAKATSLRNLHFQMSVLTAAGSATAVSNLYGERIVNKTVGDCLLVLKESPPADLPMGGFVSDLTFFGGNIGFRAGSQQFTARSLKFTSCLTAISHGKYAPSSCFSSPIYVLPWFTSHAHYFSVELVVHIEKYLGMILELLLASTCRRLGTPANQECSR